MSLIFSCGFARVAVKESFHKAGRAQQETDPVQRWKNYCNMFDETARSIFTVEKTMYMKKSRIIYNLFRKMSSQSRNDYLKHFSLSNWKALPASQKSQHTMSNCSACQVHHFDFQSLFPTTTAGKCKPQTLIRQALMESKNKGNKTIKPIQKAIKAAVKHIYSKMDAPFQKVFKVSFTEAQTKVAELDLQTKKSRTEKKRERRQRARQEKQKVQEEWSKRDADTTLATRQSFSQRAKERSSLYFESFKEAAARVEKRKRMEDLGQRKRKRHSPQPNQIEFDKENLLKEVKNMKDNEKVKKDTVHRGYQFSNGQLKIIIKRDM